MDIKLLPDGKTKNQFVFSSLPEEIKGSSSAKYQSFNIISKGTVQVPKGTDVKEISWEGVFFGESKKQETIVKTKHWKNPDECVKLLKKWLEKGTVLNLIVTNTWINMDVTISSFKATSYGAFGNIRYNIVLEEAKELKIYTTKELKIKGVTKKKKVTTRCTKKKKNVKEYVIKTNDTLYGIAKKQRGLGSDWPIIYERNRKIIDEAAMRKWNKSSDRGNKLVPGTKITIP